MFHRAAVLCLASLFAEAQENPLFERSQRQLEAGDYHNARLGFAEAHRQLEKQRGEFDVRTLDARIFHGQVLTMVGRPDLALNVLGPLMRYYDAPGRQLSKQGLIARGSFALALRESGAADRAVGMLERVVAIYPEENADDRIHIARFHSELAASYAYLERYKPAETHSRAALRLLDAAGSPPVAHRVSVWTILGQVYLLTHRFPEAEAALETALAVAPASWPKDHPELGTVHAGLGIIALRKGRLEDAERLTRAGLASVERMLGPDHIEVGAISQQLAMILQKMKRKTEAQALTLRAREIQTRSGAAGAVSVWGYSSTGSGLRRDSIIK